MAQEATINPSTNSLTYITVLCLILFLQFKKNNFIEIAQNSFIRVLLVPCLEGSYWSTLQAKSRERQAAFQRAAKEPLLCFPSKKPKKFNKM